MELRFLGLRELLMSTRAAGRLKDLVDVAALQELGLADETLGERD